MLFVDETSIMIKLHFFKEQLEILEEINHIHSKIEVKAVERVASCMIECILDIGNAVIDGFVMRDPGSYEDIIDILEDEKVIPSEDTLVLKEFIRFRKPLVRDYIEMNTGQLYDFLNNHKQVLQAFPSFVENYLSEQRHLYNTFIKK